MYKVQYYPQFQASTGGLEYISSGYGEGLIYTILIFDLSHLKNKHEFWCPAVTVKGTLSTLGHCHRALLPLHTIIWTYMQVRVIPEMRRKPMLLPSRASWGYSDNSKLFQPKSYKNKMHEIIVFFPFGHRNKKQIKLEHIMGFISARLKCGAIST